MSALKNIILDGRTVAAHKPWPRVHLSAEAWAEAAANLHAGSLTLLGLWGEPAELHMAVREPASGDIAVLSFACPDGRYPSVGAVHAPAQRLERAAHDLYGLTPVGLRDTRPWLDHGCWGVTAPLAKEPQPAQATPAPYAFLAAEGSGLHQVPVGPVHAGIIEPGHFRFHAGGETIVRLEERFGYTHKGVEGLMAGATLDVAARLAGRVSGDSTVAYALAFAQAVEAASACKVPERAIWLRALLAELERLANHLGDIGAVCNDAAFAFLHVRTAVLREQVLRACAASFGHRMMKDMIVPGGLGADLSAEGVAQIRSLLSELGARFPELVRVYDNNASIHDRTSGAGHLTAELAAEFGAGGYVGRASGRDFDARRDIGYAPYERLVPAVKTRTAGDVDARIWVRIDEVTESLRLIDDILAALPRGAVRVEVPKSKSSREGMALVEGFRGDILVWLRLAPDGRVARCHLRDPSWFLWPLLEAAIEGNIIADFPLCNKSFNCSYSGHDL